MTRLTLMLLVVAIISGCATGNKTPNPTPGEQASVRHEQPSAQSEATNISANASDKPAQDGSMPKSAPLVTPDDSIGGKVTTYNSAGQFVVLDFPAGKLPGLNQTMFVYRNGLKVGEVKITGPTRDNNTVADLVSGVANKGDEVRER